jgi:hypothetical protein
MIQVGTLWPAPPNAALRLLGRQERGFAAWVNQHIRKQIVAEAERSGRGIAIEARAAGTVRIDRHHRNTPQSGFIFRKQPQLRETRLSSRVPDDTGRIPGSCTG